MKEQIYTIPINEAFEADCDCPLCHIEKRLEQEAVEYELGPAMMEPDHRELSNKKGWCRRHLEMMFASPNKLPLALIMDTHLEEIKKDLKTGGGKKGLFKKAEFPLGDVNASCMICEKLNRTMHRYARVLCEMWRDEADFCEKFAASKGFCLPHFELLYTLGDEKFRAALLEKETEAIGKISEDIHRFTLKFDYKNRDMDWGDAKDAPARCTEKLVGYIEK